MGSLSTGFRALKGSASLFLPHYFCILNVSSQDKCPSPCFTARRDFASCGFSASVAVPSLAEQGAAGQSCGWSRVQESGAALELQLRPGLHLKGKISCRAGDVTCGVQLLLCPRCPVCLFWMSRSQHSQLLWEEHLGSSGKKIHPAFVC